VDVNNPYEFDKKTRHNIIILHNRLIKQGIKAYAMGRTLFFIRVSDHKSIRARSQTRRLIVTGRQARRIEKLAIRFARGAPQKRIERLMQSVLEGKREPR